MQTNVSSPLPTPLHAFTQAFLSLFNSRWFHWLWVATIAIFIAVAAYNVFQHQATDNIGRVDLFVGYILPLVLALVYWSVAVSTLVGHGQAMAIAYFLALSGTLASGMLSSIEPTLGGPWFAFFMIWAAPLFLHMHLQLVVPTFPRLGQALMQGFYVLSAILCIPLVRVSAVQWEDQPWFGFWRVLLRLNLAVAILVTMALLAFYYNANATALQKRKIRLLCYGTLLSVFPLFFLSLIPDLIGAPYSFQYVWTLPFLVLNPLTYAYVVSMRRQHLRYEVMFQRFASYYLTITLFFGTFFVVAAATHQLVAITQQDEGLVALLIGVGLLVLFAPLLRQVQHLVRRIWYGREMTSHNMMTWMSDTLSRTMDWSSLASLLVGELPAAMFLQQCTVYMAKDFNGFSLLGQMGIARPDDLPDRLPSQSTLVTYLMQAGRAVSDTRLRQDLATMPLAAEEAQLLTVTHTAYWVPLLSRNQIYGVMLIGPRLGDDWFSVDDAHVLNTLVTQAGVAAHNVRLIEEVRAGRQELATAHQQLLMARERERQELARDLHDDAVQQLIGISYQVQLASKMVAPKNGSPATTPLPLLVDELDSVSTNVVEVVRSLRGLIRELRPTGLEHVGLIPSLSYYIKSMQAQAQRPTLVLDAPPLTIYLPEEVIMALVRVTQEAVRNALNHAQANVITIGVHQVGPRLELTITDDGAGFAVPEQLDAFTAQNHFGLIGMMERIHLIGGEFHIESSPGHGTRLHVTVSVKGE